LLLEEKRELVVRYGRMIQEQKLTTGTGGNLSVLNPSSGLMAISPSGVDYEEIVPKDVVIMSLDGVFPEEDHREPSSEWQLHSALYRHRPDVRAIVHCHSDYATAVSCLGIDLPPVNYMIAVAGDKVPLTPFAVYGTSDLALNVVNSIGDSDAALMANHGQIALGKTMKAAFAVALNVEYVARLFILAKGAGDPVLLSRADILETRKRFKSYGQRIKDRVGDDNDASVG
jgi:L-fuculose-phosphate aldolase